MKSACNQFAEVHTGQQHLMWSFTCPGCRWIVGPNLSDICRCTRTALLFQALLLCEQAVRQIQCTILYTSFYYAFTKCNKQLLWSGTACVCLVSYAFNFKKKN